MTNEQRELRSLVRGAYDIQKLRIETGNRIVGNFKVKLGQEPGKKEDELTQEAKAILTELRAAHARITDGVVKFPKQDQFEPQGVIDSYTLLCLVAQYIRLEELETEHFKRVGATLLGFPIYVEFLEGVKGIGPAMAGVIISEIDIYKARYPSSLWAYAGLDVASDGAGRSRRKEHLVECEYVDKDGKPATRVGITFNPWLKTKLVGVLAGSFLKVGDSPYGQCYRDYKTRMENHVKYGVQRDKETDEKGHKVTSKGRRHNMAMRYAVKMFLVDLYKAWRELEGLPVEPPYSEAKLGRVHRQAV